MTTAKTILLVDDDEDLRGSLKDQLCLYDEFDVTDANTATRGMERAKADRDAAIKLDPSLTQPETK